MKPNTFTVKFSTDNAAFDANEFVYEITYILSSLISRIKDTANKEDGMEWLIRDSNGNIIGKATYVAEDGK